MTSTETKWQHTPLPWTIGDYGKIKTPNGETLLLDGVALPMRRSDESIENRNFIVQACNSFYAMRDALEAVRLAGCPRDTNEDGDCGRAHCPYCGKSMRAALALANGEQADKARGEE